MLEKQLEKVLVTEVKKLGGKAYKWTSPGNDGVPDRIVVLPNRPVIFVELKTDTGKTTALQDVQIKRLLDLGQPVFVVKGVNGLSQFFHGIGHADVAKAIDKKYRP